VNNLSIDPAHSPDQILAAIWVRLASPNYAYYRQLHRGRTRIVWWHPDNIFPHRTDFVRPARGLIPRKHPEAKQILSAVRRLESCTLPWVPTMEAVHAADNAMFSEGDKFSIDFYLRRSVLIDVLHTAPAGITPDEIKALMYERFKALTPRMTAKATTTYAAYIAAGWTDAQLVAHGYLMAGDQR
jgi:hypothetical protein